MTTTAVRPTYDVTIPGHPQDTITTIIDATLMKVPYINYLQLESDRWHRRNGREAWVAQNSEGLVWLQSWAEYQLPVDAEEGQ
jgi:hypothetical protein